MENLLDEIRDRLYEELSIANDVASSAQDILSKIIKHSKALPYSKVKHGYFEYTFQGCTLSIVYDLYYINSNIDIENVIPATKGFAKKESDGTFTLKTTVVYVRDINQYVNLNGNIQHELEHIYQMIKTGEDPLKDDKNAHLYEIANELKQKKDICKRIIGTVIYYGFKFERDAFANGIYRHIIDNPNTNPYETLKSSTTYSNIVFIKENVLETDKYREKFTLILKNYLNKDYGWFENLTNKVVKMYLNKIGKAFTRAYNELYRGKENTPLDGGIFGVGEISLDNPTAGKQKQKF